MADFDPAEEIVVVSSSMTQSDNGLAHLSSCIYIYSNSGWGEHLEDAIFVHWRFSFRLPLGAREQV